MNTTIFITGSTDGIGKLAAQQLAQAGHRVILHGRNPQKLEATTAELQAMAKDAAITGYVADLSDLKAVEAMANAINEKETRIDVLINNAGVFKSAARTDQNGLDLRFTVNYLAPVQLTNTLQPLLRNSASPRVINLSSAAQDAVALEALAGNQPLDVQAAYAQSKLALTMWSFDLAQRWDFATVIAVNPGSLLNTKMVQEAYGRHWSGADKGANILVDLATNAQHTQHSGQYFDNDQGAYGSAHPDAYDAIKIKALLDKTNTLLFA